ncbi:Xylose isomerase domain protein TIM barrel OS=Chthoniobacter flavus Ellin428 GN=CfE428DRAFT_3667 PE=4 SV=1: AP_endonuc_2 [Gemmataceae bacterium]|nr:Xylose isomerase domain protein TIM barrel OS=Chthoniobacter flavus Ellin428 GN=CfE428DRAFT_3667 PE=4 SV=1: AP_endonuc_2 [Gemmataceae bacterium]VTT98539.1 Xylose isomerase domain protein TIM barrel OS=Chthoniobacter flavus Ellin428 GN=CfE428DRAFT_3667 PE=4 SV=1: AP_endonuc_2 [Gemmataceae bacterium]
MSEITRRDWLSAALATTLTAPGAAAPPVRLPLGFSLYGMRSLPLPDALEVCKRCGYDGVELALMPGYHAAPANLTPADVKALTKRLSEAKLSVLGLMENLPALGDAATHRSNLDRLKSAADLACALVPDRPPPIETVLGGKPTDWGKVKDRLAERLADWAAVGRERKTVIAVKPHVAHALHAVADAVWLVKQVASEWIRLAFDFSHFELRGVMIEDAVKELAPLSVFAHVKDAKGTPEKFEFLLPGDGATDYPKLAKLLRDAKFTGPVVVEVSSQVSNKPGYDPASAAKSSFRAVSAAFGNRD